MKLPDAFNIAIKNRRISIGDEHVAAMSALSEVLKRNEIRMASFLALDLLNAGFAHDLAQADELAVAFTRKENKGGEDVD